MRVRSRSAAQFVGVESPWRLAVAAAAFGSTVAPVAAGVGSCSLVGSAPAAGAGFSPGAMAWSERIPVWLAVAVQVAGLGDFATGAGPVAAVVSSGTDGPLTTTAPVPAGDGSWATTAGRWAASTVTVGAAAPDGKQPLASVPALLPSATAAVSSAGASDVVVGCADRVASSEAKIAAASPAATDPVASSAEPLGEGDPADAPRRQSRSSDI